MNLDGIADERDITKKRKKVGRQAISIAEQKTNKLEGEDLAIESDNYLNEDADIKDPVYEALVEATSALLTAAAVYGIDKATPYVKRWWSEKAIPSLNKMKNKVIGKAEKIE